MDHLEHYLRYYETLEKPRYAVLVTGEWGIGKTTQVRNILNLIYNEKSAKSENPKEHIYVSLFGVSSIDDIDAEITAQINPGANLLSKIPAIAGSLVDVVTGGAAAQAIGAKMAGPLLRRELQNNDGRTIVFDDLERSGLEPLLLTGALNRYIEHFGFRVILIAHDDKLVNQFSASKEKLIGQTIKVELQTEAAWLAFVKAINPVAKREFIIKHKTAIQLGFDESKVQSLRILRHVIEDVGRLFDVMDDELTANAQGCTEYLAWFAQFDALVRDGKITNQQIKPPAKYSLGTKKDHQQDSEKAEFENMKAAVLSDAYRMNAISTKIAEMIFIDGHYDKEKINLALKQSAPFFQQTDQPAWQTLWHRHEIDAGDFLGARDEMEKQFLAHHFVMLEDMLHVFGVRISLADEGLLGKLTLSDVEKQCIEYIAYIEDKRAYPEREEGDRFTVDSITGPYGLGFSGTHSEPTKSAFTRLFSALKDSYRRFQHATLPDKAKEMLKLLGEKTEGLQQFFENRANRDLPLLNAIEPKKFIEVLLFAPRHKCREFSILLKQRYQMNRELLDEEKENLRSVIKEFDSRMNLLKSSTIDAERLKGMQLRWFFSTEIRDRLFAEPTTSEGPHS